MPVTVCPDNLASLRAELAPLYCRYPHQTEPQPAYVQLDEDGDVTTGYSGEIGGGVPAHVWHGRTLRWTVPASVRGDVLADLLAGDALPLLQRVHAGHSVQWDGNNHCGTLDDDARTASDELAALLSGLEDEADNVPVWDVADWLFSNCTLPDHWHTQSLADAVAEIEAVARSERVALDGDITRCLLDWAARAFDEAGADSLTPVHLAELVAAGRITQEQADARNT